MKKNYIVKVTGLLIVFILSVFVAVAQQTGRIAGKVTDKKTGETLIGLSVKVEGTAKGASTDVEGRYNIGGLAAGRYTLTFSYVGYQAKKVSDIAVRAGAVTTMDVVMDEAGGQQLEQVVINVSAKQESVSGLYAQQKNSISMSSGISAEVIKRSPDRNTGEVLKRVSGASIQDNKFVIVRGLNDRYNSAMINNSPLPSTEPDRKTFSFDAIPSSLIDNVVISKTASPDLPGDITGGAVQVKTKDFPDSRSFEINYGMGYNTISTFNRFYGNSRTLGDHLSFGAGKSQLPSSYPSTAAKYSNLTFDQRADVTKSFSNTWAINKLGTAMPSQSLQVIYGSSYLLNNEGKFGLILSGTYRNAATISEEARNDYDITGPATIFSYNDTYYNFNSSLALLANFSYIKGKNKFALKNLFNNSYENSTLQRSGMAENDQVRQLVSQQEVLQKLLVNSVLEGDHLVNEKNQSKVNWNVSFSRVANDQPDLRRIRFRDEVQDNTEGYIAAIPTSPSPSTSGRFYSNLGENIFGATINYTLPFSWLKQGQIFKAGLIKQYRDRSVTAHALGYRSYFSDPEELTRVASLPVSEIFADENIGADKLLIADLTNPNNQYDASSDLNSGYLMLTSQFSKLKATWGLRIENYRERLDGRDNTSASKVDNNYLDFLPSINLSYGLSDKSNLRFSFSRTVARAQFRELAEFTFYDFVIEATRIGKPSLKRTRISNFDLRYELYPTASQLISFSVFYKQLNDAIENNIESGSTPASKTFSYINAPEAYVMGAEIELRHSLGFINTNSKFFNSFIVSGNLALIDSEVDFKDFSMSINNKRQLQGQSPYLLNTALQYSSPNSEWQSSLLYNRIGRRISFVGFGNYVNGEFNAQYPDIYENPRDVLDFQISKRILKKKAELKLNVSNILDSDARLYQDINDDGKYNPSADLLMNSVHYGRTVSLSLGYKF